MWPDAAIVCQGRSCAMTRRTRVDKTTVETSALAWARRMPLGLGRSPPNLPKPGAFFSLGAFAAARSLLEPTAAS